MKMSLLNRCVLALAFVVSTWGLGPCRLLGQEPTVPDSAYVRVTEVRAEKIVQTLSIADASKGHRVRMHIAKFYQDLHEVHGQRDRALARLNGERAEGSDTSALALGDSIEEIQASVTGHQSKLHYAFLARLKVELTDDQIELVKDGLTYGVVPKTYQLYLEMYPTLTDEQKRELLAQLIEAREHAMDAGSSQEKHAWFGKYKGKINIYLSKAGFNGKEAERAWIERQKANKPADSKPTETKKSGN